MYLLPKSIRLLFGMPEIQITVCGSRPRDSVLDLPFCKRAWKASGNSTSSWVPSTHACDSDGSSCFLASAYPGIGGKSINEWKIFFSFSNKLLNLKNIHRKHVLYFKSIYKTCCALHVAFIFHALSPWASRSTEVKQWPHQGLLNTARHPSRRTHSNSCSWFWRCLFVPFYW